MAVGKMPGCQGHQRGSTKGSRNVSAFENNALTGQFVQVRGPDVGMAHKTIISPCLIIRNNVNDIWPVGRGYGESAEEEKRGPNGGSCSLFHRLIRVFFISCYFKAVSNRRLRIFGQISLPSVRSGLPAIPSCEGDCPTHWLSRPLRSTRPLAGSIVRVVKRLSR